jgi:YHS domain-containing protein
MEDVQLSETLPIAVVHTNTYEGKVYDFCAENATENLSRNARQKQETDES